jgi:hypothetical protein
MSILQDYMGIKLNSHFDKIHDEAFVYHNFLSEKELEEIMNDLNLIKAVKEKQHVVKIPSFEKYEQRFRDLFSGEELHFTKMNELQIRYPGVGQRVHIDIVNHMNPLLYMLVDKDFNGEKEEILMNPLAFIIYLNDDYEGGEICYPEYDIEYKPKAGDLVVHCVEAPHGVNIVKSGIRYTHSNVLRSKFYVDSNLFKHHASNEEWYDPDKPEHFSYSHQFSTNKRMKKLQEIFVEQEGKYYLK